MPRTIRNFKGPFLGINTKVSPRQIKDTFATNIENLLIDDQRLVRKFQDGQIIGTGLGDVYSVFRHDQTKYLVKHSEGWSVITINLEENTYTSINSFSMPAVTNSVEANFLNINKKTYIADGDKIYVFDGTVLKESGLTPPTTALTATLNSGGNTIPGTYTYRYTFYNGVRGLESAPSPASDSIAVPLNSSIVLTGFDLPQPEDNVSDVKIYKRSSLDNNWYLLRTLPIGLTQFGFYDFTSEFIGLELSPPVLTNPEGFDLDVVLISPQVNGLVANTTYQYAIINRQISSGFYSNFGLSVFVTPTAAGGSAAQILNIPTAPDGYQTVLIRRVTAVNGVISPQEWIILAVDPGGGTWQDDNQTGINIVLSTPFNPTWPSFGITVAAQDALTADNYLVPLEQGFYTYSYTLLYDGIETGAASDVESIPAGVHTVAITGLDHPFPTTSINRKRRLYRRIGTGTQILIAELGEFFTTFIDANQFVSGATDINFPVPQNNSRPPKSKFIVWYKERAFYAGNPEFPTRMYYSEIGNPEAVGPTSFFEVRRNENEPITGLIIFQGSLFSFKLNSIWQLSTGPPDFNPLTGQLSGLLPELFLVRDRIGCDHSDGGRGIINVENLIYIQHHTGLYQFNGLDTEKISRNVEGDFEPHKHSQLFVDTVKNRLLIFIPNDKIYIYNYLDRTWGPKIVNQQSFNGFVNFDNTLIEDVAYIKIGDAGALFYYIQNTLLVGHELTFKYKTPEYDWGAPAKKKRFWFFTLNHKVVEGMINCNVIVDGILESTIELDLSLSEETTVPLKAIGSRLQIELVEDASYSGQVEIFGYSIEAEDIGWH